MSPTSAANWSACGGWFLFSWPSHLCCQRSTSGLPDTTISSMQPVESSSTWGIILVRHHPSDTKFAGTGISNRWMRPVLSSRHLVLSPMHCWPAAITNSPSNQLSRPVMVSNPPFFCINRSILTIRPLSWHPSNRHPANPSTSFRRRTVRSWPRQYRLWLRKSEKSS